MISRLPKRCIFTGLLALCVTFTYGQLTFVETITNGVAGATNINDPEGLFVSPDDKHLYVASEDDDAILAFNINQSSCQLTFIAAITDGTGGANNLNGTSRVTVSPDGKFVFVTGRSDDAVTVFSRNSVDGTLTFVQDVEDGVGGVNNLEGAEFLMVSPDGKHLYVTSRDDDAVSTFSINSTSGMLTFVQDIADGTSGANNLDSPKLVMLSPDGQHVYVASNNDNAITVFSRNSTTGVLTFVEDIVDGVGGITSLEGAYGIKLSPDGKFVYVASDNDAAVTVFSRNSTTGQLTLVEVIQDGTNGANNLSDSKKLLVTPDRVIVGSEESNGTITVFERNPTNGQLTFLQEILDGSGSGSINDPEGMALTSNCSCVYIVGDNDNAINVYSAAAKVTAIIPDPVPTMSQWGLLIFGLLILNMGLFLVGRQSRID